MLRLLANICWLLFGGFMMAAGWLLIGLLAFVSIIGIPWGRACWVMARLALWPFGKEVVPRAGGGIGTGVLGMLGNIIWLIVAGLWLAIGHVSLAIAYAVTIIGIPFALQHVKLAMLSLAPIGKTTVDRESIDG